MIDVDSELLQAAINCDTERLRKAVMLGADVNAVDGGGYTAMHIVLNQLSDTALTCLNILFDVGANVTSANHAGDTPLHVVFSVADFSSMRLKRRALEASELLIQHGADVNARNVADKTPLHLALWRGCHGYFDTHQAANGDMSEDLLVATPPYPLDGCCACLPRLLSVGLKTGRMASTALAIRYLRQYHSSDIFYRREILNLLLQGGMSSCAKISHRGDTLLHIVCRAQTPIDDIRLLLEAGAGKKVNATNDDSDSPLHCFLSRPYDPPYAPSKSGAILLIKHGADVNATNGRGISPLQLVRGYSENSERESLVELLLQCGAADDT